jgi:hypothetical protein
MDGGSYNMVVVGAPHHDNGSETDAGEVEVLNTFVIPEFPSVMMPVAVIIIMVMVKRKKRKKNDKT